MTTVRNRQPVELHRHLPLDAMEGKTLMKNNRRASGIWVLVACVGLVPALGVSADQPQWEIPLTVSNGISAPFVLSFGILPDAHSCIDEADCINGHCEYIAWILPGPPCCPDWRFVNPRSGQSPCFEDGSIFDYRPFVRSSQRDTFRIQLTPWDTDSSVISWPANLGRYFAVLTLRYLNGSSSVEVDMLTETRAVVPVPGFTATVAVYSAGPRAGGSSATVPVGINAGWNLISNPVSGALPDDSVSHLFPLIMGSAFRYDEGYVACDTMETGRGYWARFPSAVTNAVSGDVLAMDSVKAVAGWNLVGSLSNAVDTGAIISVPPDLRGSNWYGWSAEGYSVADRIVPGRGFWVKANGAGTFVLVGSAVRGMTKRPGGDVPGVLNTLTITDNSGGAQTLCFGPAGGIRIPEWEYDMPPLPPAGAFDARFVTAAGGSMLQVDDSNGSFQRRVEIQSDAYPLTVTWRVRWGTYVMTHPGRSVALSGEGLIRVTDSGVKQLILKSVGGADVPREFALAQNYPNPFNPATTIRYDLPVETRVTLRVFNILGQELATLVDGVKQPGSYTVRWDAGGQASGVYFYRFEAGSYACVKTMLLLK